MIFIGEIVDDIVLESVMTAEFRKIENDAMELVIQMRYEALKMRKSIKPERTLVSRVGNYQLVTGEGRNHKRWVVKIENCVVVERLSGVGRKWRDVGQLILSLDVVDDFSPWVYRLVEYTDEVSFYYGLATLMGEFFDGLQKGRR
jgi:hypothetical protein